MKGVIKTMLLRQSKVREIKRCDDTITTHGTKWNTQYTKALSKKKTLQEELTRSKHILTGEIHDNCTKRIENSNLILEKFVELDSLL